VATQIIPDIFYRDVAAAIEWLARAFGFAEMMRTATPRGGMHAQMALDGQQIMMGQGGKEWGMLGVLTRLVRRRRAYSFTWPTWTPTTNGRARPARRLTRPPRTCPTDAATPHAILTGTGSLPRLRPMADRRE